MTDFAKDERGDTRMTVQSDAFVLDEAGVLCRYEGKAATAEVPAGVVGVR